MAYSSWALYQRLIYANRSAPLLPTAISELEGLAKKKLGRDAFWYVGGSAGEGRTASENVRVFDDWKIVSCTRLSQLALKVSR